MSDLTETMQWLSTLGDAPLEPDQSGFPDPPPGWMFEFGHNPDLFLNGGVYRCQYGEPQPRPIVYRRRLAEPGREWEGVPDGSRGYPTMHQAMAHALGFALRRSSLAWCSLAWWWRYPGTSPEVGPFDTAELAAQHAVKWHAGTDR